MKVSKQEKADAIAKLREWIKPGDTVYTVLRSVSRSGMSRVISVVLLHKEGKRIIDLHPNYSVSKACGYPLVTGAQDGIKVTGCGMDMGFALVYDLARTLFSDLPKKPVTGRNGSTAPETDAGYLLNQRWL